MNEVHYTDPSRQSELPDIDEESTSASEYVQNLQPIKEQKQKSKRRRIVVIVLLLLAAVGAGVYFFVLKPKPESQQSTPITNQQPQPEEALQTAELEEYTSEELNLSFDYPGNWIVKEEQGTIFATSPVVRLTNEAGQESDGKVTVGFLSAGSEVPIFETSQNLIAVKASEKMVYKQPAPGQRQETFLSFGGLSDEGIDAVFITGNSGYKKDQMIPESDIKKVEPIVNVSFYVCMDAECGISTDRMTLSINVWDTNNTTKEAIAILKSLKVN